MEVHAMELPPTQPQSCTDPNCRGRFRRTASPLGGGVATRFVWAVPVAALLWIAAAWAMGWLP